ncbi:P-loop containing nucleoside triphosphate hydrolase protein [Dendrothele bispora CBS 962.96]|uniref:P-loop containing nucleoside triphosphate hydrolase protein n=1 Tax=Dendrothele bispora (strain CBS 962.96) TaxID=1314807 RepID=A0A4S8MR82_DENBC|nr:P-loop containing nucleoside triphosphate hydrolase protein [Dendrothele bispora CBS 962.96]
MRPWFLPFSPEPLLSTCSSTSFHAQKPQAQSKHKEPESEPKEHFDALNLYDIWLASRSVPDERDTLLVPGAQRPLTSRNTRLAYLALTTYCFNFMKHLWHQHPTRTVMMMACHFIRSLFPAFRGYSQALIIDEMQTLIGSGSFTWSRLLYLVGTELIRRYIEGLFDSFANHNEGIILGSAKYFVEYQQLKQRTRLDVPTFSDPLTRDLLLESDLFARSFNGGGFGSISPLDFFQLLTLFTEIVSHLFLIFSVTNTYTHIGILLLSLFSVALPLVLPTSPFLSSSSSDSIYTKKEARAADRREKMRNLVYNDSYRPEVLLFGLENWILKSWSSAWKVVYDSEQTQFSPNLSLFPGVSVSDLFSALQNIPFLLLLQTSSATLGSLTLYRSSVQSVVFGIRNLLATTRMVFQSVFLMVAFGASTEIKPKLQPEPKDKVEYRSIPGGVSIRARNLSYTYPGCSEPALKNINLTLEAGETLAIVGYNGSGKSTLANILLRIFDYDQGQLLLNDVDVRRYDPTDYHRHVSAVFQGFSKFNSTVRENVGIGRIESLPHRPLIEAALGLASADAVVNSLPYGIQTVLECPGYEALSYPGSRHLADQVHGLSGGEWQRIAIARAFMRANDPEIDLLVFDEPTSSLDAHAQNQIFNTINRISRHRDDGTRLKTVVFITHRLSTARRADKVAMMENGTITEFGTHEELLKKNGSYAALYRQAV